MHSPLSQGLYDIGYGVVLDSGTTFSYLPTEAYQGFLQLLEAYIKAKGLQRVAGPDPRVRACSGCVVCVDACTTRTLLTTTHCSSLYKHATHCDTHSLPTRTFAGAALRRSSRPTAWATTFRRCS